MTDRVEIEWRVRAYPAYPPLDKSEPPGPWTDYPAKTAKEAADFLPAMQRLAAQNRTIFEYRLKPA